MFVGWASDQGTKHVGCAWNGRRLLSYDYWKDQPYSTREVGVFHLFMS